MAQTPSSCAPRELIDQQMGVHKAVDDLLSALRQARPHGRDYQTLGTPASSLFDAHQLADARYIKVADIKDEAMAIAMNVQEQAARNKATA